VTDAARATPYRRVGAAAAAAFVTLLLLGLARHVDAALPAPASPRSSLQYQPPSSAAPTDPGRDEDRGAPRSADGDGPGGRDGFDGGGAGEDRGAFGGGTDGGAPPSATPAPNTSRGATT
jgi:hypothetical protein